MFKNFLTKVRKASEIKVINHPEIEFRSRGKIVIDPGHGKDSQGRWKRPLMTLGDRSYREDMGTLEVAKLLRGELNREGYEVYLTREDERDAKEFMIAKYGVGKWKSPTWCIKWFTKKIDPDIFISLHTNAHDNKNASGPICFWGSEKDQPLAEVLSKNISEDFDLPNRGIRKKRFLIIRNIFPSVLFEIMFHTCETDLEILIENKKKIAKSLKKAVLEFFVSRKL